ncbi:hypothetical protein [Polaribacter sp. IC073]|uniref:hypothetical protein n=1 Tax=Polaribacter sp. IC073 TaxID=2508540 RepID=UPI0011BE25E0|nr:hypothetical protein [Polaribacter sp. IC073]TXD48627.1 hypothetical protein ES045_05215 [Polaribacter sp. IC073]
MSFKEHKTPKKLFIIKSYQSLSKIEIVLRHIDQKSNNALQLSILGKLPTNTKELKNSTIVIKKELSAILGKEFQFGYFHNPEIGSLFISGHLTPTFLNKVDEKELASLSTGISGILRGLGIKKDNINTYLTALKNNHYCLIIRGESSVLDIIAPILIE